jgi:hypothetical protein
VENGVTEQARRIPVLLLSKRELPKVEKRRALS